MRPSQRGFIPVPPKPWRVPPRLFDVNDIVALKVYDHLISEGMKPANAGPLACGLRNLLSEHPEADKVFWVKGSIGSQTWVLADHFDHDAVTFDGMDIISLREWRLNHMRQFIIHKIGSARNRIYDPRYSTKS